MADLVTIDFNFHYNTTNVDEKYSFGPKSFAVSAEVFVAGVQEIGTTPEAIVMGEVSVPGWSYWENLDSTNFVEINPGTGDDDLVRMNAGEPALFRFAADATAPFGTADTLACKVRYFIAQN